MASIQIAGSHKITGPYNLRDRYRQVTDRIAEAAVRSGRRPSDIYCVAVTKTASPDQIRTLVEMGHVDLGESRVQPLGQRVASIEEFLLRKRTLPGAAHKNATPASQSVSKVRWHMLGHLQRNKVKPVQTPLYLGYHKTFKTDASEKFGWRLSLKQLWYAEELFQGKLAQSDQAKTLCEH